MNPINTLFSQFHPVVLLHVAAALAALLSGLFVFLGRKGTPGHRRLGRSWVALMAVVALSSFFIRASGHFSLVHGLSIVMTASLAWGVMRARQRNFRSHRITLLSCYVSLWVAGLFTLMPHRMLGRLLLA